MKALYYTTYIVKEIALAGALFAAGFCLLLNLQFVSGVEVSGRLIVALGIAGLSSFAVYETARYFNIKLRNKIEGENK